MTKGRPAIIVSHGIVAGSLVWVAMITSDVPGKTMLEGDVKIAAYTAAGLDQPSIVRCAKVAAMDASLAQKRGEIRGAKLDEIMGFIRQAIGTA